MARHYRVSRVHKKDKWLEDLPGTLPRNEITRKEYNDKVKEDTIQEDTEKYLSLRGVFFIHIPNHVWRHLSTKAPAWIGKLAASALAGLPDILAFNGSGMGLRCLALELKTKKGQLNPKQRYLKTKLGTLVARSFGEAKEIIDKWLDLPVDAPEITPVYTNLPLGL